MSWLTLLKHLKLQDFHEWNAAKRHSFKSIDVSFFSFDDFSVVSVDKLHFKKYLYGLRNYEKGVSYKKIAPWLFSTEVYILTTVFIFQTLFLTLLVCQTLYWYLKCYIFIPYEALLWFIKPYLNYESLVLLTFFNQHISYSFSRIDSFRVYNEAVTFKVVPQIRL